MNNKPATIFLPVIVGIWNNLAGINYCESNPGIKQVLIKPQPVDNLTWAKAEYETSFGFIRVDWNLEGGKFSLNLVVPPNSSTLVELPQLNENDLVRERGAVVGENHPDGFTSDDMHRIPALARTYNFAIK